MKKLASISLYVFGLALVITSALLLAHPTTAFAAACVANCRYGSPISVTGDSCSCTDNVGCTFTANGRKFTQQCASPGGGE
jgi:hypothetical protein